MDVARVSVADHHAGKEHSGNQGPRRAPSRLGATFYRSEHGTKDEAFDPVAFRIGPVAATRFVEGGDLIDLGDRRLLVVPLPGHTPGSIGLFDEAGGALFSGDAIYDGGLIDTLPGSDVAAYLRTMERLRELPVEVVYAGHDEPFGREQLRRLCDAYIRRRG